MSNENTIEVVTTCPFCGEDHIVEVPEDVAEKVIGAMHKNFIKGYRVNIEPAKVRERR